MTITYTQDLHTVGWFSFFRLLLRWRGSFYKLILPQSLVFFAIYFALMIVYSFFLTEKSRRDFEGAITMIAHSKSHLGSAVAFFLGFFIDQVFRRFWAQYLIIPWPDGFSFLTSVHLGGTNNRSRVMRRTLVRYVCAATVMGLTGVSPKIKRRFPNYRSYITADLLTENEAKIIDSLQTEFDKYYLPLSWATALLRRARKEGRIKDDFGYNELVCEIDKIRGQLGFMSCFVWITVPLVLTHPFEKWQFTSGEIFSVELLDDAEELDRATRLRMKFFFVLITWVQFSLYAGMMHTSESLLFPFGDNDGDIDIDQLIDRHLRVGYLIVDEMYAVIPELTTDNYWSCSPDNIQMPYTAVTNKEKKNTSPPSGAVSFNTVDAKT